MKITIHNSILHTAAREKGRYSIDGVCIHESGVVSATDGRCFSVRKLAAGHEPIGKMEKTIVPSAIMPKPTTKPKMVSVEVNGLEATGLHVSVARNGDAVPTGPEVSLPVIDETYPPISDVGPRVDEADQYALVSLNPDLLHKVCQAVRDPENGCVTLCVRIGAPNKPVMVVGHGEDAGAGVLMPVNGGEPLVMKSRYETGAKLIQSAQ